MKNFIKMREGGNNWLVRGNIRFIRYLTWNPPSFVLPKRHCSSFFIPNIFPQDLTVQQNKIYIFKQRIKVHVTFCIEIKTKACFWVYRVLFVFHFAPLTIHLVNKLPFITCICETGPQHTATSLIWNPRFVWKLNILWYKSLNKIRQQYVTSSYFQNNRLETDKRLNSAYVFQFSSEKLDTTERGMAFNHFVGWSHFNCSRFNGKRLLILPI